MEVKYLVYKGSKESGTLVVKQMPANSPFRELRYTTGMKKEIGSDIPAKVADMIVGSYKTIFGYETVVLDDKESLRREFSQMIQRYIMMDPVEIHETIVSIIENAFGIEETSEATAEITTEKPAGRVRRK